MHRGVLAGWGWVLMNRKLVLFVLAAAVVVATAAAVEWREANAARASAGDPSPVYGRAASGPITAFPGVAAASAAAVAVAGTQPATSQRNAERNAYFGDLHVHTRLSFDAYIFNVRASPDDAYRYARGEPIRHALGYDLRLTDAPLDFLAVTDHAEYLGILPAMNDPQHPLSHVPWAPALFSDDLAQIGQAFQRIGASLRDSTYIEEIRDPATRAAAWKQVIDAAERHYVPGRFTTFVGYEYTSAPGGRNLHRNVIFAGASVPEMPFSAMESQNPEDLWRWMDELRARGMESLAIPHNSNGSDGSMFARTTWDGKPVDRAWAELRIRNEPLVEITQIKGTSETHPSLSPSDEWSSFEIMPSYIGSPTTVTVFDGGYVRRALQQGLQFDASLGVDPFHVGFIGSSDTHNAAGNVDERDFQGKVGVQDGLPQRRGSIPPIGEHAWDSAEPQPGIARFSTWGAAGLAGVWAEENTRESIYAALRRKETFATSGPRMRVRFFAGHDLPADILDRSDQIALAYRTATPMGGDLLTRRGAAPTFMVWAMRDPHSGWLQRVQVVKGWNAGGQPREQVFDVACADGARPDASTHRCPDNGASVDPKTCAVSRGSGAVELRALWRDPGFDASQRAFYYVRVLENPSCRWSTWDALRVGTPPNPRVPQFIQERAWSSPIWVTPRA